MFQPFQKRHFICSIPICGLVFLAAVMLGGCSPAEIQLNDEGQTNGAAPAVFDKVAAAATAEASATSTVYVDYLAEVEAATARWEASGIDSYELKLSYNEGSGGFQGFNIRVENNKINRFQQTCSPERTCFRVKINSEVDFTVDGILATLKELAEQRVPLAILRFNEETGVPEAITTNSDESPLIRSYRVEFFKVITD